MMKTPIKLLTVILLFATSQASAQSAIPKWKIADLERYMDTTSAPTILNFWATFCKPCIAEIPHFQAMTAKYRSSGVRLLLVSLDLPEDYKKIKAFAQKRKITAPIVFLDESNADLFCPKVDSIWSGALPASLFINRKNGYRYFIEESLSRTQLELQIRKMLALPQ
ncbi:MAG: TlpA family protein disulfide reductase [Chitinophagaceae bacterium]|nr:MAG: TlpA family protein disulfide reductase [Chitinophagaceae bacterium]